MSLLISYAQNFEDVMLWRALKHVKNGFYIDVGAQDPIVDSVSLAFYEHEWRGVHIEPTHHYATLLRQRRPDETVLETAIGAKAGIIRFYEIPETGISTADETIAKQHKERGFKIVEINVPCVTLASVFKSCARKDVHWLKIDVEGLEEQVLAGWKPSKVRPWIVVVESTLPLTQVESYESWEPMLLGYGYSYVYFDGLNRFYVSNAQKELQDAFLAPPNVFDGFSVNGTANTSVHRLLVDRHSKQIENLNAVVVEHAGRERAAVESVAAIQSSTQGELAKSLHDREERETLMREKSEARERELMNILTAAQGESARRLDLLSQQSVADRSETAAAHDQVNVLQHTLTVREREFGDQLTRARAEFESSARELISANLREASQREELLQKQIEALRTESQAIVHKLIESNGAHAAQVANVERLAQSAVLAEVHAREMREKFLLAEAAAERDAANRAYASAAEREQILVMQARRDIEAAHAELKAQLLQMASQERMHSENIMRLHDDLRQQLDTQSRSFSERENVLRSEFAAQMFSQYGASEENKSAALKREHELNNALNAETRSRDLLEFQLNDIKREVAIAHAHEHALQLEASNYLQQIATHQAEVSLIRGTFSWRLTSPLRLVAGWIGWRQPQHEMLPDPSGLTSPLLDLTLARVTAMTSSANPADLLLERNDVGIHEPSALICYFSENPMANISHVNQLFELHDITFVRAAYQCLLGRDSDDAGEEFYVARLRSGIAKADIIFEISQSDEGKRIDNGIAGLREFVEAHPPVRNRGFRSTIVRLTRIEHQVNRLENELARASAEYLRTGDSIQAKLQNLENLLRTLNDANDQRMKQMESAFTTLQRDSDLQIVAALDSRFMSFSGDVGRRFDQVEANVTNLHESVAQQLEMLIAAQKKRDESSVEIADAIPPESVTTEPSSEQANSNILLLHAVDQFEPTPPVVFPALKGLRKLYYYIDHTVLCPVNTGMQRVARRLGRALLEAGEQIYFVKWDAFQHSFALVNRDELEHFGLWNGPFLSAERFMQYPLKGEDVKAIEKHVFEEGHWLIVPEVTHITYQPHAMTLDVVMEAKRLGLRSAFIYYDATPLRRAELSGMAKSHETYMQQLLLADLVLPISNWSCSDLVSFFHVHEKATLTPTPRIVAIPLPGESQLAQRVTTPMKASELHKLILCVGSITPHKNQIALVHVFEQFCELHPNTEWQLSLVGNLHPDLADEIMRAVRENSKIKYLEHVSDEQLDALYRHCAFTVFPSLEEGFGLPILESLWYGKPCICANFGAMAEVAADGGCYAVDVQNGDALLKAVALLIDQPEKLKKLSVEAVGRNITDWRDYGKRFVEQLDVMSEPLSRLGVIYYWVDHTSTYPSNSGIQRVVRGLAQALISLGLKLVPVKWNSATSLFYPPSQKELQHLELWNGVNCNNWAEWVNPSDASTRDWILIPELTTYLSADTLSEVRRFANASELRVASIFFDAIPWKMRDIYSPQGVYAHGQYMEALNEFELVLPISMFARDDLMSFLSSSQHRTPSLGNRMQACVLPGEFLESDRVLVTKRTDGKAVKILCVGTVEPRKNHIGLLQAFAQVVARVARPVELIIAGGGPFVELAKQVEKIIEKNPGVRWETGIDDARLRALYAECDFTVYPSLEEGFGLPILESLWYARPCICRDSGAMQEVAAGGGCVMVDTADTALLAQEIFRLVSDESQREALALEAINRPIKTWRDYGREVATRMALERGTTLAPLSPKTIMPTDFYARLVNVSRRPLLSICISTYNRAKWLTLNLQNLANLHPSPSEEIEIVVCDNASTDNTCDVVQPYLARQDFRYYRNPENVGMLGNLRVTAHHARGQYIWILGDDDLVAPGGIENILQVIRLNPNLALVYLNYAYTREEDATVIIDLDKFFEEAPPICQPSPDILGTVSQISTESENFFTAIYCLVFRRDHALRAYSQNIEGRPFSTLLTCIPTTYHALNFMMDEPAYWLGQPQLVVNLNVSWMKYAPLWILERIPEAYDLAEKMGASPEAVDRWRNHNLPSVLHFLKEIYESDKESNAEYFLPSRLLGRIKHLEKFPEQVQAMQMIYEQAHFAGHPKAKIPTVQIFPSFKTN